MDLVPKTGLRGRRTVGSFDRLRLVGLVGLITLLLLRLGVSLILRSIFLTLRLGGRVSVVVGIGVGRLLTWLVHSNRLSSRSFRLRIGA